MYVGTEGEEAPQDTEKGYIWAQVGKKGNENQHISTNSQRLCTITGTLDHGRPLSPSPFTVVGQGACNESKNVVSGITQSGCKEEEFEYIRTPLYNHTKTCNSAGYPSAGGCRSNTCP
jgi:hypothetical protein